MPQAGKVIASNSDGQQSRGQLRSDLLSSSVNTTHLPSYLTPGPLPEGLGARGWLPSRHALFLHRAPRHDLLPLRPPTPHTITHRRLKESRKGGSSFSAVLTLITVHLGSTLGPVHRLETEAQLGKHCCLLIQVLQTATPHYFTEATWEGTQGINM